VGAVNANAMIDHRNLGTAVATPINLELNPPALTAVLHSVVDEVRDSLTEAVAITSNQKLAFADDINTAAMLCRDWSESVCNLLSQRDQVELGLAQRDLARFKGGEIKHLIGHLHKVEHLYLDLRAAARYTRDITLRRRTANRFGEEANR
jgi:hypothetical protein